MIVRILGSGQFRLAEDAAATANSLDERLQAAADAGDEAGFAAALSELVATIRAAGTPLPVEEIVPSDAIVPDVGTSLAEARALLSPDGLIPD